MYIAWKGLYKGFTFIRFSTDTCESFIGFHDEVYRELVSGCFLSLLFWAILMKGMLMGNKVVRQARCGFLASLGSGLRVGVAQ